MCLPISVQDNPNSREWRDKPSAIKVFISFRPKTFEDTAIASQELFLSHEKKHENIWRLQKNIISLQRINNEIRSLK